ncbi:Retrovirus-related Pol polyprotein from transposon TNT 1-94 [Glycine max]|nr:Retrovirus-related Pol polyprotein from transposon TNT 1-94 [Glycine max]
MLKEATLKALWGKLENIYVLKSLTNCLCLKMKLYQLKIKMGGNLHYHINKFNQPEYAMLLLASLPRSFKALVQTLFVGRSTLKWDEVTTVLREK